ncbi:N-acetylmuramoyl-L-alanine amidase family protein [Chitinophaga nivalis]|uniref:N-acetylmuramoyl-L-alanine amidase n=1 Tax=Chitinophaga nivalis TaxID=2991709 RepID=A0ABT3IPQ9_9BACT|nr:N-acetylmuramoyl-L-alanine amidase [Chitinophaga nivalis]MCW3464355.1 N-acetylmuramoyl-L-alanine amidase [Chitinophaga nivalis]MCW3485954.1 N-acetylmuramoyl-L-alanine amidase [Chitinophaga nivalis]
MRRNRFWILGLGTLLTCTLFIRAKNNPVFPEQDKPIKTIVIDAGHGGEDPGAKGSYSTEKQVTLEVALKLGKILEENMPDVKVVYTRKSDRYDDPRKKAQIANDNKGELFVSIHCNSTGKIRKVTGYKTVYHKKGRKKVPVQQAIYAYFPSNAKGTETYIWATSKNNAKMESLKQNSVIVLDANSDETKQLMDDTDPETFILLNTLRNAYFDQSLRLSTLIEDEFTRVGRISRGARQRNEKGIWVLSATAMPSVLVELGFISNPEEEDYLNSNNGQQELATCIYKAIKRYRDELNRFTGHGKQPSSSEAAGSSPQAYLKPAKSGKGIPAAPLQGDNYCVQLLVTDKFYTPGASIFRKLHGDVSRQQIVMNKKKMNKYIWGHFKTDRQASTALRKARKLGFKDAFVTAC